MVPHEPGGLLMVRKSQDVVVGALVQMLKKAPPLRQDISFTGDLLQDSKLKTPTNCNQDSNEISKKSNILQYTSTNLASSGLASSKTTSDALDELRGYRELKDLILKQGDKVRFGATKYKRCSIPRTPSQYKICFASQITVVSSSEPIFSQPHRIQHRFNNIDCDLSQSIYFLFSFLFLGTYAHQRIFMIAVLTGHTMALVGLENGRILVVTSCKVIYS